MLCLFNISFSIFLNILKFITFKLKLTESLNTEKNEKKLGQTVTGMASRPVLNRITVPICCFMNTNSIVKVPCRTLLSRARIVHLALLRKFYTSSGLHLQLWRDSHSSNPVTGSQFSVASTPITGTKYMGRTSGKIYLCSSLQRAQAEVS